MGDVIHMLSCRQVWGFLSNPCHFYLLQHSIYFRGGPTLGMAMFLQYDPVPMALGD